MIKIHSNFVTIIVILESYYTLTLYLVKQMNMMVNWLLQMTTILTRQPYFTSHPALYSMTSNSTFAIKLFSVKIWMKMTKFKGTFIFHLPGRYRFRFSVNSSEIVNRPIRHTSLVIQKTFILALLFKFIW